MNGKLRGNRVLATAQNSYSHREDQIIVAEDTAGKLRLGFEISGIVAQSVRLSLSLSALIQTVGTR